MDTMAGHAIWTKVSANYIISMTIRTDSIHRLKWRRRCRGYFGETAKMPPISPSADNSLLESAFYRSDYSRPKPDRAVTILRSILGFTLVEMTVVLAVVAILIAAGGLGFNHYREQYAFSGAVRELTHAITVARVRAMQSQTTSRLLFRPVQTAAPTAYWVTASHYIVGDFVQHGTWMYRCIAVHDSNADNEPGAGDNLVSGVSWRQVWEIVSDYQYNANLINVQQCPGGVNCVDANPYNVASPVSIQFNWSGVPSDYISHDIVLQGAQYAGGPPVENSVGYLVLTVTPLGKINRVGER